MIEGIVLIALGIALRFWAMRELSKVGMSDYRFYGTYAPHRYLTKGPFRLRHPCYIGTLLFVAGIGCIALGLPGVVLALPLLPFIEWRIRREELLRERIEYLRGDLARAKRAFHGAQGSPEVH